MLIPFVIGLEVKVEFAADYGFRQAWVIGKFGGGE
jgi:hypothetical protein